ncbi:MAG: hypothetical protein H6701_03085 [Myxococcales bacterium]|nr:hypothetical protein [Myxococcales bacterium]
MNMASPPRILTASPLYDAGLIGTARRVVDGDEDDGEPPQPGAEVLSARHFITRSGAFHDSPVIIDCADLRPHGPGYYAAVVAEARGLRARPDLRALVAAPRRATRRPQPGAIGVLTEPASTLAPSDPAGIEAIVEAIERAGLPARVITVDTPDPLRGLRALIVRATTAATGPVMALVRRADALGIALLEPPDVVVRCCDKVFQAVRFAAAGVPTPETLVVFPDELDRVEQALGYPCVIKLPDSSGARDVHRVDDRAALEAVMTRLGAESAALIAQAWTPSAFDWRIGALDGELLFASRYDMVPGHWQIHLWQAGEMQGAGPDRAVPFSAVPPSVLDAALRAARAIGGGLVGVDVKEIAGEARVIEVNDTPTIFRGEEDALVGPALYDRLVAAVLRRAEVEVATRPPRPRPRRRTGEGARWSAAR